MKKVGFSFVCILLACGAFADEPQVPEIPNYVVISPKNYVDLWTWYIGERKTAHPEINFAVKSAEDIYRDYPYDSANADGKPRNAAESIHAYIGEQKEKGTKYFVLGGNWFDASMTLLREVVKHREVS